MALRRLFSLALILGVLSLGAPAPAVAAPLHHLPPTDCGSSGPDEAAPVCINACLSRILCPPGPSIVGRAAPAPAESHPLRPANDRLPGRSLGPEPPPPRI